MRVITAQALEQNPALYDEAAQVLHEEGLVCFPTRRQYVVAASLFSEEAVVRLVQSKRRSSRAPALVLIPDRKQLAKVVADVPKQALTLIDVFWPGPLTLLLPPSEGLPPRVIKTLLDRKNPKLGVRVCSGPYTTALLQAFRGPLLISSANFSQKVGASSIAQIRKNFTHTVDLLIDAGDVPAGSPSTIVEFEAGQAKVQREGSITASQIQEALEQAAALLGA